MMKRKRSEKNGDRDQNHEIGDTPNLSDDDGNGGDDDDGDDDDGNGGDDDDGELVEA